VSVARRLARRERFAGRRVDRKGWPVRALTASNVGSEISATSYRFRAGLRASIFARQLSTDAAEALRARARIEGATVHGALSAAAASAFSQRRPGRPVAPPRVFTPMDARRRLLDGAENLGVQVCGVTARTDAGGSFWDDARAFTGIVARSSEPPVPAQAVGAAPTVVADVDTIDRATSVWAQVVGAEVLLANLARVDIPLDYGPLQLTRLWGPVVLVGIESGQSIGVTTMGGRIHLLHTGYEPDAGLLDTIVATLESAAG
jgi:hypothetical protein